MLAFLGSWFDFLVDNGLWLAINIAVPVFLPYLVVVVIAITEATSGTPGVARTLMRKSVDTGQLFWTAIAMLAATIHDVVSVWDKQAAAHKAMGWIIGLCIFAALVCTLFVGFSTYKTVSSSSGVANKYVINISIGVTVAMCFFYPLVHFKFS